MTQDTAERLAGVIADALSELDRHDEHLLAALLSHVQDELEHRSKSITID